MNGTTPPNPYPGIESAKPPTDDPAFQPPAEPLADANALRGRVRVIHREIPNVTVQTGWGVQDVRNALVDLTAGLFDRPAQLQDAIAGDSRVQSAMRQRSGGLLGRPIRFKLPEKYRKDSQAKKCLRVWERHWPQMAAEPSLLDLLETAHGLGFSYAQTLWDTNREIWLPYLQPFNARFSYYHWEYRIHVGVTRDGQVPITPGDGHWVQHAPYGGYRGWMRGGLRALAQWWLARAYALRDWARYCERHGFPILLFDTPFGADPTDISNGQSQLQALGQESILQVPGSVDVTKYGKYDLRYLEPADENWQAFKALIEQCNSEITLALLGQNLTSQVQEGSFAAARVHADVRQAILEADARALSRTIYVQVARPFAALNFGNPDLAPVIHWDVRPPEDLKVKADTFSAFASGLNSLRTAGFQLKNPEAFARKFGLRGLALDPVPPVMIEAQLARATGQDEEKKTNDSAKKIDKAAARLDGSIGEWTKRFRRLTSRSEARIQEIGREVANEIKEAGREASKDVESAGENATLRIGAKAEAASIGFGLRIAASERRSEEIAERIEGTVAEVEGAARKAVAAATEQIASVVANGAKQIETAFTKPPPEIPFAQRSAALLADIKEHRELGFEPDIESLAALHKVPVPQPKR